MEKSSCQSNPREKNHSNHIVAISGCNWAEISPLFYLQSWKGKQHYSSCFQLSRNSPIDYKVFTKWLQTSLRLKAAADVSSTEFQAADADHGHSRLGFNGNICIIHQSRWWVIVYSLSLFHSLFSCYKHLIISSALPHTCHSNSTRWPLWSLSQWCHNTTASSTTATVQLLLLSKYIGTENSSQQIWHNHLWFLFSCICLHIHY